MKNEIDFIMKKIWSDDFESFFKPICILHDGEVWQDPKSSTELF